MAATTIPRRLLLVGSVVADVRVRVPHLPVRGADVLAAEMSVTAGGGAFVLGAAVRGGLPASYAGRHGHGRFGDAVRSALIAAGVDLDLAKDETEDTGPCIVLVEPDGERTMITVNGVEASLSAETLERLDVRDDDAVYVSGYDLAYPGSGPGIASLLGRLPPTTLVALDPGPLVAQIPDRTLDAVLGRTDLLSLDRQEAQAMTGRTQPAEAGSMLGKQIARDAIIVVRDGSSTVTVITESSVLEVPVSAVEARDTTGAGDLHAGALLAARAHHLPWPDAVRAANEMVARELRRRRSL